jgi:predicted nucleotidyltransferase
MSTPADIKATLARHLPELKKRYPIGRMALFGSVTRNDFNPAESDIDILVEFNGDIAGSSLTWNKNSPTSLAEAWTWFPNER